MGSAPRSSLHLFDKVQSKAILINNPSLTKSLQSLSHRRLVADLSTFYPYLHGHCSLEIKSIIPDFLKHVRPIRSSTQSQPSQAILSIIHELFPTNLLSFQEPINFGTPYLPLPFLNPATYLASNLTSTNWISSPYLLKSPFSFFLCQGFVIGSIGLSLTLLTTKKKIPTH